ncbi:MAG: alkaline phosphatase family protein [Actinomycetota bacterium]|nr:alkaline phosphatase family protein [Actinomycetota bacterium]
MKKVLAVCLLALLGAGGCDGSKDPSSSAPGSRSPIESTTAAEPTGDWFQSACDLPLHDLQIVKRGFYGDRTPDISFIPREPNFFGGFDYNSHSGPWDYVQRIPFIFYGPGFVKPQGSITLDREVTAADFAPTAAELLGFEWPEGRAGRPLTEVLVPEAERPDPPKLIFTVVWDGSGWNVLERWPDAWPNLAQMIEEGTSVEHGIVGSSPSVTPAVHATIGTGTFPNQHGIADIPLRINGRMVGSWPDRSPTYLVTPTLADLYDKSTDNESLVGMVGDHNWHLGMIGHGAGLEGGDKDVAIMFNGFEPLTNTTYYDLPQYLANVGGLEEDIRTVDLLDGELDEKWQGNAVLDHDEDAKKTPAGSLYETRVIKALIEGEGFGDDDTPDLLYVNYKQIDWVGHEWTMSRPEMRDAIKYSDQELGELRDYLDETVGRGEWVIAVTADHGSTPDETETGAWPIYLNQLKESLMEHFDDPTGEMFMDERVTGFWLDRDFLKARGITVPEISNFILGLKIKDNIPPSYDVPDEYDDRMNELLFSAAFPSKQIDRIMACAEDA